MSVLSLPVSYGDAADRMTILAIKKARISDAAKQANIVREYEMISPIFLSAIPDTPAMDALMQRLRAINEQLWTIEDDIRSCEARGDFGSEFVRLARAVYQSNDERARIKREINDVLQSPLMEEKSYRDPGGLAAR